MLLRTLIVALVVQLTLSSSAFAGPQKRGTGKKYTPEEFHAAGLYLKDYRDYERSGVSYEMWAAQRNKESGALEVFKWITLSGGTLLTSIGLLSLSSGDTEPLYTAMFLVPGLLISWPLLLVDSLDFKSVPDSLENHSSQVSFGLMPQEGGISASLSMQF